MLSVVRCRLSAISRLDGTWGRAAHRLGASVLWSAGLRPAGPPAFSRPGGWEGECTARDCQPKLADRPVEDRRSTGGTRDSQPGAEDWQITDNGQRITLDGKRTPTCGELY